MEQIFAELIKERQENSFPSFIPRENKAYLHQDYQNIYAITGPRRAGKTYFIYQIITHLIETKQCEKKDILFLNFEDFRLTGLQLLEIDDMFKAYKRLYQQDPKFIIFDEVQNIPQRQKVLRTFHDRRKYKIIVTGSSSKLHTDEISTELRGRYTHTMLLPFSFSEYLTYKKLDISELERTYDTDQIYLAFQEYMQYGGFPVVISTDPMQKRELINEYYATTYHRDVIERNNIRNKNLIERFMKYILNMYSSQFSISNLETYLKSEGTLVSKATLAKYLSYLREAFFTIHCFKFGYSTTVQLANPVKLYLIDPGFIRLGTNYSENKGAILENLVAIELFRRDAEFFYFEEKNECDFVIKSHLSQPIQQVIQVTRELNFTSQKREIDGLVQAMKQFQLSEGYILTYDQEEEREENGHKIHILPVWKRMTQ